MKKRYCIGVVFCGGCNCYFDRKEVYEEIKKKFDETCCFHISSLDNIMESDFTILINGCQSECLTNNYDEHVILINNKNYQSAKQLINEELAKMELQ